MNKISRYILFELLKTFVMSVTAMTGLAVLIFLGQEGMRQGLGPEAVIRLVPYVLPNALSFAIPGTILFSACVVYGRMSSSNEIVAIKSMGVSATTVVYPAICLSIVLSGFTLWLNDVAVSWGRQKVYEVVLDSVEETIYSRLRSHKSFNNKRVSIDVMDVIGKTMIAPRVVLYNKDGNPTQTITAERASMTCTPKSGILKIVLENGRIDDDKATLYFSDAIHQQISLADMTRKSIDSASTSNIPLRAIASEIEKQTWRIDQVKKIQTINAGMSLMMGDFSHVATPDWEKSNKEIYDSEIRLCKLQTEPWRRWANGFSCLFFVIVGVPLAIRLRNADVWTTFGLCFIPILILYFPLVLLGIQRAKIGAWPPYSVWLGNAILFAVGIALMRKIAKF